MTHLLRRLLAVVLLSLLAAQAGHAQVDETAAPEEVAAEDQTASAAIFADSAEWDSFASRVEEAIAAGRASTATLDTLRTELADWRDTFMARQSANAGRIATVQAQLTALGEAPADGGSEAPEIAARRAALSAQLDELRAPAALAKEAHARADGLIGEIDTLIRDRQVGELAERVQSPLNPAGWSRTLDAVANGFRSTRAEISTAWANSAKRQAALDALPQTVLLLVGALLLLLRGRRWIGWVEGLITTRSRRGQGVWRFVLSLGQVALPVLGLVLLAGALSATGLLGRRGETFVVALPILGIFPILAHWVSRLLLTPAVAEGDPPLTLPEGARGRAQRLLITMGYVLAVSGAVSAFVSANSIDSVPQAVLSFAVGIVLALVLFRIGSVLRQSEEAVEDDPNTPRSFRAVARRLVGRALMLLSLAAVLAGALGYVAVFELLLFPAAMTLYLMGLLVILQRLSVDMYTLLKKIDDGAQDALIPVLIGFALVLLALPVLALIWGARVTELTELWARFQEGFALGETRISPTDFLTFAIVFIAGYTLTRLLQGALRSSVLPRTKLDVGGQNAIVAGIGYVGIFLAAVVAITTAGIDLSGLAIVAGALSVGIGFGLQTIVQNFVSGIILLIERPISQGDWIEVNGQMGYVRDISVRATRIETFDRTDVIIPNADLISGQVTNWTRGNSVGRLILPVGVAYGTDTHRVSAILKEIAEAHPMVVMNPPPAVVFQGFGADSLDFEIRAILRDVNFILTVKTDLNHEIAARFAEEAIEIPFAQRDIWLRNPEVLRGGQGGGTEEDMGDSHAHLQPDDMPDPESDDGGETA